MTTSSNEEKDWEQNEENGKFNSQPKSQLDESELTEKKDKDTLNRIEKLMQLSFRLVRPTNDFTEQGAESAYKRRGFDLKHIPHSSEKIAKGFDDSI
ncbi:MAG: hypothetical protein Q8L90_04705 [Bacteroidota bacterium]|nr:hypothetical protein [Bacteroidota bacterium]